MNYAELLNRARGSLYGLAIGDALGAPVEGWSAEEIREKHGWVTHFLQDQVAGTDDTEFAVLTARMICQSKGVPTPEFMAKQWLVHCHDWPTRWDLMSSGCMSEKRAVANLLQGKLPPISGRDHMAADSCGAAMRAAPCGIAAPGDLDMARRLARADASVSHWDEGVFQAEAIAAAVCMAMIGAEFRVILGAALSALPEDSWTRRVVKDCHQTMLRASTPQESAINAWRVTDTGRPASHGPGAFALALNAFRFGKGDFRKTVLLAVNAGRDCDSSAAQAGAIVGALVGYDRLPAEWTSRIGPLPGKTLTPMANVQLDDVAHELTAFAATTLGIQQSAAPLPPAPARPSEGAR
jgi:ADP-ribosylglycohydrolase